MRKPNYYVIQTYNDRGEVTAKVMTAEEAESQGYKLGCQYKEDEDLYVDGFSSLKQAKAFAKQASFA